MKTSLITYTIAVDTSKNLLAACTPDNNAEALDRALADYRAARPGQHPEIQLHHDLTLTDEPDSDTDQIVWQSRHGNWLSDEDGTTYDYAVVRTVVDVRVTSDGTLWLAQPLTRAGIAWLTEHITPNATWRGPALVVPPRSVEALTKGMVLAGLRIEQILDGRG